MKQGLEKGFDYKKVLKAFKKGGPPALCVRRRRALTKVFALACEQQHDRKRCGFYRAPSAGWLLRCWRLARPCQGFGGARGSRRLVAISAA